MKLVHIFLLAQVSSSPRWSHAFELPVDVHSSTLHLDDPDVKLQLMTKKCEMIYGMVPHNVW